MFNLRHASARNVIERIFGIMKRRFPILSHGNEYDLDVNCNLVRALCGLHNFIRKDSEDSEDRLFEEPPTPADNAPNDERQHRDFSSTETISERRARGKALQNRLAESFWLRQGPRARN